MGLLRGARILAEEDADTGNSSTFLEILAFEILLKAALRLEARDNQISHNYVCGWARLSENTRNFALKTGTERYRPDWAPADPTRTLADLRRAFTDGKYGYEALETIGDGTREGNIARGEAWLEAGAPENEADFNFRPRERAVLIYGLRHWIDQRLGVETPAVI